MISADAALDDVGAVAGHDGLILNLLAVSEKFLAMDFEPQNIPLAHTRPLLSETFVMPLTTSRFRAKESSFWSPRNGLHGDAGGGSGSQAEGFVLSTG